MMDTMTSSDAALGPLPTDYAAGRRDHHRLAYSVVAEARRLATGRFGLRSVPGGYGTPEFDDPDTGVTVTVGVSGADLVVTRDGDARSAPITTLRAAADHVGIEPGTTAAEHDSPPLGDVDQPLVATSEIGRALDAWFAVGWAALEVLRATPGAVDPDVTQLWPGHFDAATAIGDVDAGRRATYGVSPGDDAHPEPYVYVGAWGGVDDDPFWNATAFAGALLPHEDVVAADDATATVLGFLREGYRRLNG